MKAVATLAVTLALAFPGAGAGPGAGAETPFAGPFDHSPIHYHLDSSNLTLTTYWYKVKVKQALTYWEENTNGAVPWNPRFVEEENASRADIRIWFLDASIVDAACDNMTSALGCTRLDTDAPQWSIELKTRREDGQHYSYDLVGDVAKHEIGHALGLPHSSDPRDIMYYARDATAYGDAQPIDDFRPVFVGIGVLLVLIVGSVIVILRTAREPEEDEEEATASEPTPRPPRPPT